VGDLLDEYVERYCKPNQRKWGLASRMFDSHVKPTLGRKPLAELRRADIVELLDDLQNKKGLRAQVNRVRSEVLAALNWGIEREYLDTNPAAAIKRRKIEVPRDRDGSFEPVIVKKRQRRLSGIDNAVLALTARGLTTGEVEAFFDETYGVHLGKDTISRITEKVIEEMTDWCHRPLDSVYPVVFVDAVYVKIRDGQVVNRPIYVALAVTTNGEREILGLWAGDGSEGAKYWLSVLGEIKNRGVTDVCIVVCDGLKGLPDAINTVWPAAIVQACVLHLIRNSFHYAGRHDWEKMAKDLRPI